MKSKKWKYKEPKTIKDLIEQHGLVTHIENPNMSNIEFWESFEAWYGNVKIKGYGYSIWHKMTRPIRLYFALRRYKKEKNEKLREG